MISDKEFVELCKDGTVDEVRQALADGATPNAGTEGYRTALMAAVDAGNLPVVQTLLSAGADVNVLTVVKIYWDGVPGMFDYLSSTALMCAAQKNDPAVIQALLAAGAEVNIQGVDDGQTALMLAAKNDNLPAVEALLAAGAEVNACDKEGMTALIYAARFSHAAVVAELLAAGADKKLKDKRGCNARWHAQDSAEHCNRELITDPAERELEYEKIVLLLENAPAQS